MGVCCNSSYRWQIAWAPHHHPSPRAVWKADAAQQNQSLAAEQPVCQHLLSNPSPDNIFTKFLLTPPSLGTLQAWLPSDWSPQHFPHPHRNICSSDGAGHTVPKSNLSFEEGGCLFFWLPSIKPPQNPETLRSQKFLAKGEEGVDL